MTQLDELARAFGIDWFDYQLEAFEAERFTDSASLRACLFYRTGAGKTYTALALMKQAGVDAILVVAPPATHARWKADAALAGLTITAISHQLYRSKGVKFSRLMPVIIDEFHMLGGQTGAGWTKLRTHARGMQAPLVILSATPNYNDVERVYCVSHVLDPVASRGGYIEWIYKNCNTQVNPFGSLPLVDGFSDGRPAKAHLAEMPHVYYVEDPHDDFPIGDVVLPTSIPDELMTLGVDRRRGRICASRMEYLSAARKHQLVDEDGRLAEHVYQVLAEQAGMASTPVLVFCARKEIAVAAHAAAVEHGAKSGLVTYMPNPTQNRATLESFKRGELDVLFGTSTMSTGVDGLDKVCDMLVLLDDTDDESLRRQVIGRILPRGASTDASKKIVVRLLLGA